MLSSMNIFSIDYKQYRWLQLNLNQKKGNYRQRHLAVAFARKWAKQLVLIDLNWMGFWSKIGHEDEMLQFVDWTASNSSRHLLGISSFLTFRLFQRPYISSRHFLGICAPSNKQGSFFWRMTLFTTFHESHAPAHTPDSLNIFHLNTPLNSAIISPMTRPLSTRFEHHPTLK